MVRILQKEDLKRRLLERLIYSVGKDTEHAVPRDWCVALILTIRDRVVDNWMMTTRRVYQEKRKRVRTQCPIRPADKRRSLGIEWADWKIEPACHTVAGQCSNKLFQACRDSSNVRRASSTFFFAPMRNSCE